MRWGVLLVAVLMGCGSDPDPAPAAEPEPEPAAEPEPELDALPSILLITVDTTRADHLGVYGYERPTSPTIDRMGREGLVVMEAITTMPSTDPAHLSILTGQYPRTHGVRRNGVPAVPNLDNLASWASSRGHQTAAFVSRQHVKPSALGLEGFDHEDGPDSPQREGGITLRRALAWLDAHEGEPWFVWVHFFDPHRPYAAPDPYGRRFVPASVEQLPAVQRTQRLDPERTELFTQQYDGEIAYTDSLVARLWDHVRPAQPLIVLAADHGEHLGELWERHRFSFGHGKYLYGGSLHVPMIVWWGEHITPRSVTGPVSVVDVPATIFELVGDDGFVSRGTSITGTTPAQRTHTFTERCELDEAYRTRRGIPERQIAVRDGMFSLIVSYPEETTELYDLRADPGETDDVSEARPEVVSGLRAALDRWLEETPSATAASLDPERIEALRALGYIE